VNYAAEIGSRSMIYIPRFMIIGLSIQVILTLLPQQFERLQCWYYSWDGFMTLGAMIYIPSFMKIGTGVQATLRF
jgi:hypothetical protein